LAKTMRMGKIDYQKLAIKSDVADELRKLSVELSSNGHSRVTLSETLRMLIREHREAHDNSFAWLGDAG